MGSYTSISTRVVDRGVAESKLASGLPNTRRHRASDLGPSNQRMNAAACNDRAAFKGGVLAFANLLLVGVDGDVELVGGVVD
jgi:hypothetical protein